MSNKRSIKELADILKVLDQKILRGRSLEERIIISDHFRNLFITEYQNVDNNYLIKLDLKTRSDYFFLGSSCFFSSSLALENYAIGLWGKLFYFCIFNNYIHEAFFYIPSVAFVPSIYRKMLEAIWWEVWLRSKNLEAGLQFIQYLPLDMKFERQFIHLLEGKFGKGFNDFTLSDFQSNWILLPYPVHKFIIWFMEKLEANDYGPGLNLLVDFLIADPKLQKELRAKVNLRLMQPEADLTKK